MSPRISDTHRSLRRVSRTQSPAAGMQTGHCHGDMKAVKVNVTSCCEILDGSLTAPCLPLHVTVYNFTCKSHQLTQRVCGMWWKEHFRSSKQKATRRWSYFGHPGKKKRFILSCLMFADSLTVFLFKIRKLRELIDLFAQRLLKTKL